MVPIRRTARKVLQSQALRYAALVLLLPTLLLTPGPAETLLLHSHCDESHHLHVLNGIEITAWTNVHAGEHHCAGEESDACCEASAPSEGPGGIILQRPPMLACRARSIETDASQTALNAVLPDFVGAYVPALRDPTEAPRDRCTPYRCVDALLLSSHALLI